MLKNKKNNYMTINLGYKNENFQFKLIKQYDACTIDGF